MEWETNGTDGSVNIALFAPKPIARLGGGAGHRGKWTQLDGWTDSKTFYADIVHAM